MANIVLKDTKCTGCGSAAAFDPDLQTLLCTSCKMPIECAGDNAIEGTDAAANCPNCGDVLIIVAGSKSAKCDSCDSTFAAFGADDDCEFVGDIPNNHKFIEPFQVAEGAYRVALIDWLSKQRHTPPDMFKKMATVQSEGCYVPHYFCSAAYKGTYTAMIGYERTVVTTTRNGTTTRTVIDWRPHRGHAQGTVTNMCKATHHFHKIMKNCNSQNNAKQAKAVKPAQMGAIENPANRILNSRTPYDPKFTHGFNVLPADVPATSVYDKKLFNQKIIADISSYAPGDHIKMVKFSGEIYPDFFMVHRPAWNTVYCYGDSVCYNISDGTNSTAHYGTRPICVDSRRKSRLLATPFWLGLITLCIFLGIWIWQWIEELPFSNLGWPVLVSSTIALTFGIIWCVVKGRQRKMLNKAAARYKENPVEIFGRRSKRIVSI